MRYTIVFNTLNAKYNNNNQNPYNFRKGYKFF